MTFGRPSSIAAYADALELPLDVEDEALKANMMTPTALPTVGGANRRGDGLAAVDVGGGSGRGLVWPGTGCLDIVIQSEGLVSRRVGVLDHGESGEDAVQGVGDLCIYLSASFVTPRTSRSFISGGVYGILPHHLH